MVLFFFWNKEKKKSEVKFKIYKILINKILEKSINCNLKVVILNIK